jgi:hypothetical protein
MLQRVLDALRRSARHTRDFFDSEVVRETGTEPADKRLPKAQLRRRLSDGTYFVAVVAASEGPLWIHLENEQFRRMVGELNALLEDLDRNSTKAE